MKKMFFLVAIFQNKFGKADKYYDDKGWHWMLASDKPTLFDTIADAKKEADELSKDILSEIRIKEIEVHEMLWEHRVESPLNFTPTDITYDLEERGTYIFLSTKKQLAEAKLIHGLYRIDRKQDIWIYGTDKSTAPLSSKQPEELIFECYQKLQEAKALMQIFEFDKSQIAKIDGVMVFVHRLLQGNTHSPVLDSDIATTPEELLLTSYEKLEEAKALILTTKGPSSELSKLEGVMLFVKKLI